MIEPRSDYYTPRQLAERLDFITFGQLQWLLFQRKENGLSSAVRKIGRRIVISESAFLEWLDAQKEC